MSTDARLQEISAEYQKLHSDLAILVEKRTRLDTQLSENEMVKKVSGILFNINTDHNFLLLSGIRKPHSKQHRIQASRARPCSSRPE